MEGAGKSTLMNALLKERLLITGQMETTYTVSWFQYGETPGMTAVLKDGRKIDAPITDVEKWTARESLKGNPLLNEVAYIIIRCPNEMLKKMELIDTPGLFSTYIKDSQNTLDFLGMKVKNREMDEQVLKAFHGEGGIKSSPINALGIFSKIDLYWVSQPKEDPFQLVQDTLEIHKKQLSGQLYDILPVAAKAVEAALDVDDASLEYLKILSKEDPKELVELMQLLADWDEEEDGPLPIPLPAFRELTASLSQYGVYSICQALRRGVEKGELKDYLYEKSGVKKVADVILRHFGSRAELMKVNYVMRRIEGRFWELCRKTKEETIRKVCERILEDIQNIREKEQAFRELDLLEDYYNGKFTFDDAEDERQFLEITGEYGDGCEAKLGKAEGCSIRELKEEARKRSIRWNGIAGDPGFSEELCQAAEVVGRSLEKMHYHLSALCGIS